MNKETKKSNKCLKCDRLTHKESKHCIFHASAEEKTEEDFKRELRDDENNIKEENGDYNFEEFIFVGNIDFREDLGIAIFKNANFREATFKGDTFFYEADFEGYTDFRRAAFEGDANFGEAIFKVDADFGKATFKRYTGFGKATFKGKADFRRADFEGYTDFRRAAFEGDANFGEAIFKVDADFREAIFKGYTGFWEVTFKRYTGFGKATFKGKANFRKVTFEGGAGFWEVIFKGNTDFGKATFVGYTGFWETIFEGNADFREAIFKGNTDFGEAIFKRYTGFGETTFKGNADFGKVTFEGGAGFGKATFKGNADFGKVTFEGGAGFGKATFKGNADFKDVIFKDDADFRLKHFDKIVNFSRIKVLSGKKLFIKLNNKGGKISFERSCLENTYLEIELVESILIDFTGALLKNTKIKKGQVENHIFQEKKKKFYDAQEIYLLLKNNFHSIGQYKDESWAFTKERDMERLSQSFPYYIVDLKNKGKKENLPILRWIRKGYFKKWIISAFSNMIYGYGEKPWNVVIVAGVIIIVFAYFFSLIGIGNLEIIELQGKIHPIPGTDMRLVSEGVLQNTKIMQFSNCLYFSLVTFATLGYGDFRPLEGIGRILAGSEAFIGAFMMALFVYTFARRMGGR